MSTSNGFENDLPAHEKGYIAGSLDHSFIEDALSPEEQASELGLSGQDRVLFLACYQLSYYQSFSQEEE